ncbi:MAG: TIGR03032 family protein [Phycisphaera sp.]|nr:TIGR03032 family protein [Phycisphaera sp.]
MANPRSPRLEVIASRGFYDWLGAESVSLAVTTYQAGKLLLIGRQDNGRLGVFERTFNRCMGLWGNGQTLWMTSRFQLWRFENVWAEGVSHGGFDRLYVPQAGYTTGDIDVHDIAPDADGRPVFISTLFGCIATTHPRFSFDPLWRPPFVSKISAEDRCHLNGLAMCDGRPAYVTVCAQSDVVDGWRDHRRDGGCVIDVESGEIVATGFSMPHSPRLYRDKLWLIDSGNGYFGYVDTQTGQFERVAFCPGYGRGLAFFGDYAVVGLSRPRHEEASFQGLALDDELSKRKAQARCGLQVIDLKTGDASQWLRIEGGLIEELYDVVILPGVSRPKALGFKTDEIQRQVWFDDSGEVSSWTGTDK